MVALRASGAHATAARRTRTKENVMIIDLPLGTDPRVLQDAADEVGVELAPIGQRRDLQPRDTSGRVTRVDSVRIVPRRGSDVYRAYTYDGPSEVDGSPLLGRRKNAICWHGHRDWMRAIFRRHPETVIRSALAVYKGSQDFEYSHEDTRPTDARRGLCRCED
jgi:hypothetical protein